MEEEKEVCYFSGKNGECYHNRNVSIVLCRIQGKCDKCKYQAKRCELIHVGGDSV